MKKICRNCGVPKLLSEYSLNGSGQGYRLDCKPCRSAQECKRHRLKQNRAKIVDCPAEVSSFCPVDEPQIVESTHAQLLEQLQEINENQQREIAELQHKVSNAVRIITSRDKMHGEQIKEIKDANCNLAGALNASECQKADLRRLADGYKLAFEEKGEQIKHLHKAIDDLTAANDRARAEVTAAQKQAARYEREHSEMIEQLNEANLKIKQQGEFLARLGDKTLAETLAVIVKDNAELVTRLAWFDQLVPAVRDLLEASEKCNSIAMQSQRESLKRVYQWMGYKL